MFKYLVLAQFMAAQLLETADTRRRRNERGSITLEQILWSAGLFTVAVAVIAIIVAAVNRYAGQIN